MKTMVLLSGGLDSTVLLYAISTVENSVEAVGVDYAQRHNRELDFARQSCAKLGVPFTLLNFPSLGYALRTSSQTNPAVPVPEGHYAEESMKATIVPNRNMVLLALAGSLAIDREMDRLAYAAHAGDHAIYPDCREEFVDAMSKAFALCDWHKLELYAPFLKSPKGDIVRIGSGLGVPFKETWSCYKGGLKHCGKCGTCVERREAFKLAGVVDPTEYES